MLFPFKINWNINHIFIFGKTRRVSFDTTVYIYIYRSLEDCATIPIKMLQNIYWQNFRSTNDLAQCLSKLDWICKD